MITQQLPAIPRESAISAHELGGRIDPATVTRICAEIAGDLQALYAAIDSLSLAEQRLEQMESAFASQLELNGNRVKDRVAGAIGRYRAGAGAGTYTFNLFNVAEQETDSSRYSLEQAQQDAGAGVLRLSGTEIQHLPAAVCRLERTSSPVTAGDPGALVRGRPWAASAVCRRRLVLLPERWSGRQDGLACELSVEFPRPVTVNTINLAAGEGFPLLVGPVYLYQEDRPEELPLVIGEAERAWLEGETSYILPNLRVKKARFLLNQRHYLLRETPSGVWYEYACGLGRLEINQRTYLPAGEWISRPVEAGGIIGVVSLEAEEERPVPPAEELGDLPLTSVEYFVQAAGEDNWYPVLPLGFGRVEHELLAVAAGTGGYAAVLRFPSDGGVLVFRNGQMLMPGQDYLVDDGRTVRLLDYRPGVYTASYTPQTSAYRVLTINEQTCRQTEETFPGTDAAGAVTLKYSPYLDKRLVNAAPGDWDPSVVDGYYCPLQVLVYDHSGSVLAQPAAGQAGQVYNVTPYRGKVPAAPEGALTYQVVGRQVVFNRPLDDGHLISVTYTRGPEAVRVRVVLRRHFDAYTGFTPVIRSLRLKFEGV